MHASACLARTLFFCGKTVVHHIPPMVLPSKTYVLLRFGVLFWPLIRLHYFFCCLFPPLLHSPFLLHALTCRHHLCNDDIQRLKGHWKRRCNAIKAAKRVRLHTFIKFCDVYIYILEIEDIAAGHGIFQSTGRCTSPPSRKCMPSYFLLSDACLHGLGLQV